MYVWEACWIFWNAVHLFPKNFQLFEIHPSEAPPDPKLSHKHGDHGGEGRVACRIASQWMFDTCPNQGWGDEIDLKGTMKSFESHLWSFLGVQVWKKTTPFPSLSKNTLGDLRCGQQLPSRMLRDGKGWRIVWSDGSFCRFMENHCGQLVWWHLAERARSDAELRGAALDAADTLADINWKHSNLRG